VAVRERWCIYGFGFSFFSLGKNLDFQFRILIFVINPLFVFLA